MQEAKRIALLIDCDNVPPDAIEGVLEELAKYGVVNVRHAHGDWNLRDQWNGELGFLVDFYFRRQAAAQEQQRGGAKQARQADFSEHVRCPGSPVPIVRHCFYRRIPHT